MMNFRNELKMLDAVTTTRQNHTGKNWPMMMPSTMAMSSFGSSPSLNFFFSIRIKSSFSYSDLCAAPDSALSAAARTASLSRNVKFSLDVLTHLV